ncbi:hypothetical protein PC128_g19396 [Phytophthora cactorum]|nr:hypothetical protein PC128_g19396 [Phytophthora cactorum]
MASVYDEVEIEDMEFNAEEQVYYYPCPCGDRFSIDLEELYDGEDIATCPSCSLTIRVIFDEENLPEPAEEEEEEESVSAVSSDRLRPSSSKLERIKTPSVYSPVALRIMNKTDALETGSICLQQLQQQVAQISFADLTFAPSMEWPPSLRFFLLPGHLATSMKFFSSVFAVSLLVASALTIDAGTTTQVSDNCDTGFSQTGERSSTYGKQGVPIAKSGFSLAGSSNTGQNNNDQSNPDQNNPDQNATSSDGSQEQTAPVLKGDCILTGVYINNTDVSECQTILVDSLQVPAGVMLNLTKLQNNTRISFHGTSTFGKMLWAGPLIELQGNNLTVTGPGTLDGQGAWYWAQARNLTKPRWLFKMHKVVNSTVSGLNVLNMPFHAFAVESCNYTTISGVTVNSSAGDGIAKNTDGFDLDKNDHVTITKNRVYGQDDCLAMQSSTNIVFSNNYCCGTHGISIGSLGGPEQNSSTTVDGLTVTGNTIVNSTNGIRIKTIIGLKGLVTNAVYTNNELLNVTHAIVIQQDQGWLCRHADKSGEDHEHYYRRSDGNGGEFVRHRGESGRCVELDV